MIRRIKGFKVGFPAILKKQEDIIQKSGLIAFDCKMVMRITLFYNVFG